MKVEFLADVNSGMFKGAKKGDIQDIQEAFVRHDLLLRTPPLVRILPTDDDLKQAARLEELEAENESLKKQLEAKHIAVANKDKMMKEATKTK